jgi:hypothetical protein
LKKSAKREEQVMSTTPNQAGPQLITTKSRGTIVKVPDASPGLLIVDGHQRQFTLEGVWQSPVAPSPNMTVDVELDPAGTIAAISAVDSRQIAKEQFNKLSGKLGDFAQGQGKDGANIATGQLKNLAARMGTVTLVSAAALWIAWFFLPGYKLDLGFLGSKSYTLWQFLGLNLEQLGTIEISHGIGSMLGILCIAVPFIAPFIQDPRARFANVLPLLYSLIAIYSQRSSIIKVFDGPGVSDASSALSMQLGSYIVLAAGAVIAARALKRSA